MNKVLLVDDEKFVRMGLRSLIDWEKCGYEVCGEATNGEEAIHFIKQAAPDLVITDIKMPVVDGLELIREIKENLELQTNFIIVSGHNDFAYAQKAVRYGVLDYILKPIDKDELQKSLSKLTIKRHKQKVRFGTQVEQPQKEVFTEHLFKEIVLDTLDDKQMDDWEKILDLKQCSELYYVLIELNDVLPDQQNIELKKNHIGKKQICPILKKLLSPHTIFALHELSDHAFGLLITSKHLSAYHGRIESLSTRIVQRMDEDLKQKCTVYVGKPVQSLSVWKESIESVNRIRDYKYIDTSNTLLYTEVNQHSVIYNELDHRLTMGLMEQIEENNAAEIKSMIEQIFIEFQQKSFAPKSIKTSINRCIHGLIKTVRSMDGEEMLFKTKAVMLQWEGYNVTALTLKHLFTNFALEVAEVIQELRKEKLKGDIHKIKKYVEMNYHHNISLKKIAQTFYMNPVYMGQLFKKTYGMYFKEFLLNLRIDQAKKLLRQTNKRVYEIAKEVGFGSTDYFVTQFEKINQTTPTEYRNQLLQKSKE
ncbi:response regulator transcription factor [Bacillus horti]|uniref:Two-component system response regulator YesN n=1 Tax=Caldalkalibacillus horti TaxID=77523 RepID=A0ABT9W2I8_9BACI|nr:response regulator transcription factor [Bacillus horti]MDQ0167469.1 two-component system response regulator YesN [Bacillus horti]